VVTIRLKQGLLFYVYNLIIPLVMPSLLIIIIGLFFNSSWQNILIVFSTQFYLYNTILLSNNIGLLNSIKNKKKPFIQENTALSLCFVWINLILLLISLMMNFSNMINEWTLAILFFISLLLIYITLFLVSRNELISFTVKPPNVNKLSRDRENEEKKLRNKILKKGKK